MGIWLEKTLRQHFIRFYTISHYERSAYLDYIHSCTQGCCPRMPRFQQLVPLLAARVAEADVSGGLLAQSFYEWEYFGTPLYPAGYRNWKLMVWLSYSQNLVSWFCLSEIRKSRASYKLLYSKTCVINGFSKDTINDKHFYTQVTP